jgi:hypothetical protein
MGWATDIYACTTSASPPPEGSPQGARPPAPDSGFPVTRTADFPSRTVTSPGNGPHAQIIDPGSRVAEIWRPPSRGLSVVRPYKTRS